jgi:hypothetical protein
MIIGCAGQSSDTKLNAGKSKEAIIQEKINALQAEHDVISAEIENILKLDKSNGLSNKTKDMNKSAVATTEVNKQWFSRLEKKKSDIEFWNDQIPTSKKIFNAKIISVNIAKANVDLQKAKAKAGKITEEYVKLAKINLDIAKADLESTEIDIKISKCYIKMVEIEIRTGIGVVITTDENRRKEILKKVQLSLTKHVLRSLGCILKT